MGRRSGKRERGRAFAVDLVPSLGYELETGLSLGAGDELLYLGALVVLNW